MSHPAAITLTVVFGTIGLIMCIWTIYTVAERRLVKHLQNGPEEELSQRLKAVADRHRREFSLR